MDTTLNLKCHLVVEARKVKNIKKMKLFIVLSLISLISADTSVTIYSSKSINDVSEKFISHEIDFYDLMQYRGNLALVTPSYLKLRNFLKYLKNFDDQDFNKAAISSVFKSL